MIYLRQCPVDACGKFCKHGVWVTLEEDTKEIIDHHVEQGIVTVKKDTLCPDCQEEVRDGKRNQATL